MKFALLGLDANILEFVGAAQRHPRHEIAFAYGLTDAQQQSLKALVPHVALRDHWEELLLDTQQLGVLIPAATGLSGEAAQIRAEQLRKLAQAAVPMLIVHPGCEAIVGFEIEMIRRDTSGVIAAYVPDLPATLLDWLAQHRDSRSQPGSTLGSLEQFVIQRRVLTRSVAELRQALARDMLVVRHLLGDIRKVSALGQAFERAAPFHLNVGLDTASQILARWSIVSTPEQPLVRFDLIGTSGQASAWLDVENRCWSVQSGPSSEISTQQFELQGQPEQALDWLSRAMQDESPHSSDARVAAAQHAWIDACRAVEVAETVERSVAKGKTIELFNEEHSEEETFKGVMAVGSCALLMIALLVLVVGAMIEGVRLPYARRNQPAANSSASVDRPADNNVAAPAARRPLWLRLWPTYPLLAFLLLQLLNLVFRGQPPGPNPAADTAHAR